MSLDFLIAFEFVSIDIMESATMMLSVRLAGYQPQYFPRLHYFARILDSDIFTVSDYLQYVRKHAFPGKNGEMHRGVSYQAHAPIKTASGTELLDIPVKRGDLLTIHSAPIEYAAPWYKKQLKSIEWNYRKAPYFKEYYPELEALLMRQHATLAELTISSILWSLAVLLELPRTREKNTSADDIKLPHEDFRLKKIIILSQSAIPPPDKSKGRDANDWIIDTCKTLGAEEYYFGGTSGSAYMDFERFTKADIKLIEQQWACKEYPQQHGAFIPNLSILDLIMNVSPGEARQILKTNQ